MLGAAKATHVDRFVQPLPQGPPALHHPRDADLILVMDACFITGGWRGVCGAAAAQFARPAAGV